MNDKNILKFDNLVYEVKNKDKEIHTKYARIINRLSGEIESGKITAVMGASGCGKTHFFELLIGNLSSDCKTSGTITYNGEERDDGSWMKKIAFLPQDDIFYADLTVYESIMYNLSFTSLTHKEKVDIAKEALEASSIYSKRDAPIKTLSGGERKRAMIAITLVNNPEILILDEPTTGLDSNSSFRIVSSLKEYAEKNNKIVIMTVHQPGEGLFNLFGDLIFLTRGGLFYSGPVTDIRNFLTENKINVSDKISIAEFLFLLHSDDSNNYFEPSRYKRTIEEIEARNASNSIKTPEVCNNRKVFSYNCSLKHVYLLLKHNIMLLQKSPSKFQTFCMFLGISAIFYGFSYIGYVSYSGVMIKKINFDTAEDYNFRQNLIVAYSIFTYFFISQIVIYTPCFSLNMQEQKIFNLEIFTRKYSIMSHFIYNIIQKFLVCLFFITIDVIMNYALLMKNVVPMKIMILTYLMIMMFLFLTILSNNILSSIPLGPKMSMLTLLSNNISLYLPHPVLWSDYYITLKLLGESGKHILNAVFIFPNVCFDILFNVLTRTEFLKSDNLKLKENIRNLKYEGRLLGSMEESGKFFDETYITNPEWVLKYFSINLNTDKLKIVGGVSVFACIVLSIFLIRLFKAPNIRTRLQNLRILAFI